MGEDTHTQTHSRHPMPNMVTHTHRERDTHTDALTPVNTPHGHTHRERETRRHIYASPRPTWSHTLVPVRALSKMLQ